MAKREFRIHFSLFLPPPAALLALMLAAGLTACRPSEPTAESPSDGPIRITVWAHHGKPDEWRTIQDQVRRFNSSQDEVSAELIEIAEAGYDTQVHAAAASDRLPDVLEFDGPMLANYAWKGYLVPIGNRLDPVILDDLLPSILDQGTYDQEFFAVGTFDSGLGLYGNRRLLREAGARLPTGISDAWSIAEFDEILQALAGREETGNGDGQVLDLKRDYRGEWWTYGFYPVLVSAGADLIDRSDYQHATGTLNSPAAVRAMAHLQNWVTQNRVDPNADGRAFIDQRVALSWAGHWEFHRYEAALGDDLILLPLPDFGQGTRTAMGSWAWAITRECAQPAAAVQFLEFLLQPAEVLAIVNANGAVPATRTAVNRSELYREGGPLRLFALQLEDVVVPRPRTPAYPIITSAFQEAILSIFQGSEIQAQLDRAARSIDQDIQDNRGYPSL